MQVKKETIIPIWPSTHVRTTQGDRWLFAVSEEYLKDYDERKGTERKRAGGNLRRKRQLDKYKAYKMELGWWAQQNGFVMPTGHFAIWFYIPFPPSWRPKKCLEMAGKPHTSTPDLDNLLKGFFDAVMPRKNKTKKEKGSDDRKIHCYTAFKVWVKQDDAAIRLVEYNQDEFCRIFLNSV